MTPLRVIGNAGVHLQAVRTLLLTRKAYGLHSGCGRQGALVECNPSRLSNKGLTVDLAPGMAPSRGRRSAALSWLLGSSSWTPDHFAWQDLVCPQARCRSCDTLAIAVGCIWKFTPVKSSVLSPPAPWCPPFPRYTGHPAHAFCEPRGCFLALCVTRPAV